MSGHNKWSQIKHKKAKEDAKKGKLFTRLIKEITVAARAGGGDPALNAPLRHLLEEARSINMPLDNATRAIKRGTGELPGTQYEAITYEGYGPHGIALMVDTLSDNRNRTVAELRFLFSSNGGTLGETGSVGWMFERCGVIHITGQQLSEDILLEQLFNFNIKDIRHNDDGFYIICDTKELDAIRTALKAQKYHVESAKFEWVAKNSIELPEHEAERVVEFFSAIEDHDDVQNIYSNLA